MKTSWEVHTPELLERKKVQPVNFQISVSVLIICISAAMKAPGALFPSSWFSSWGSRAQTVSRACLQRTEPPTQPDYQQVRISVAHRVYVQCICIVWLTAVYPFPFAARSLHEVSLHESIRYSPGDPVEKWLNELLCLDCLNIPRLISGCPLPQTCELYPLFP